MTTCTQGSSSAAWGEVLVFREAERLISRRYLGGEHVLYPHSARVLHEVLEQLAESKKICQTMIDRRPPKSDEGLLRWVLGEPTQESLDPPAVPLEDLTEKSPDTGRAARSLAEQYVLIGRAEALDALGERDAGVRLVEDWLRSRD